MAMKTGVCKLCGNQRDLIGKSHIIPNFMYTDILDDQHRMILQPLKEESRSARYLQTGFFEKNMLCEHCDNVIIGAPERYASGVLYGNPIKEKPVVKKAMSGDGMRFLILENIDYTKFKLFVLSVLWRAHVSRNEFFAKIDITANEEEIRDKLFSGNAGSEDDFIISLLAIKDRQEGMVRLLPDPAVKKIGAGSFATFFIGGIVYFIDLKPKSNFEMFLHFPLQRTGQTRVPILSGEMANAFLTAFGLPAKVADHFTDSKDL
jgi:hypothetical protein